MLQAVKEEAGGGFKKANDQELVADMFMEGRFGISLDYHARLFQSMHLTLDKPLPRCKPIDDIHVVGKGQLHNKRTETYPAVFHFNGGLFMCVRIFDFKMLHHVFLLACASVSYIFVGKSAHI